MAIAVAMARAIASASPAASRSPLALLLSKRFVFVVSPSAGASPLAGLFRKRLPAVATPFSHAIRVLAASGAARLNQIRCNVHRSGDSAYCPLNSGSGSSDGPTTEMPSLFPERDFEHWLIDMDKPGGEGATKQQIMHCYIQTLAKVVGSEEEAKKMICVVSFKHYFAFGCKIDKEMASKLEGLPGVLRVLPCSYVDAKYKDHGGEQEAQEDPKGKGKAKIDE